MPCRCVGLFEKCCSWSSEGSAEMQVGQTSVCCVGLVVGHKKQAVAFAGIAAPPSLTVGLVAVLVTVLLLFFSSPDLL